MTNLIDSIKLVFTPALVNDIAEKLGENTTNIEKGIQGGISAVLVVLLSKLGRGGIELILHDAKRKYNIDDSLPQDFPAYINDIAANSPGNGPASRFGILLYDVFGDRLNPIIDSLAAWSSVKSSSYHQLLAAIVPLTISVIHTHTSIEKELNVSNYLLAQQENILKSIPFNLNLREILGETATAFFEEGSREDATPDMGKALNRDDSVINIVDPENASAFPEKRRSDGWLVILLLVIAMGIVWWLWKGCRENHDTPGLAISSFIDSPTSHTTYDININHEATSIFQKP